MASCHATCRIGGWSKTCQAITESPWTHPAKPCPRLSTTTLSESQQNGAAGLKTVGLQKLIINTRLFLHILVSRPSDSGVWVFHGGWKLQPLQLGCSCTSPLRCPGDEDVPGPHPDTGGSRGRPDAAAEELPARPPPLPGRTRARQARAAAMGPEPAGGTSGRIQTPRPYVAPSGSARLLHSAAHQFRLGPEGAGPSGVLSQAKPGS